MVLEVLGNMFRSNLAIGASPSTLPNKTSIFPVTTAPKAEEGNKTKRISNVDGILPSPRARNFRKKGGCGALYQESRGGDG